MQVVDSSGNLLSNAEGLEVSLTLENTDSDNSGLVILNETGSNDTTGSFGVFLVLDGEFETYNFKILSSGNFKVKAEAVNQEELMIDSEMTAEFTIVNRVKDIVLDYSPADPALFENFTISVSLIGEDDNDYLGDSDIMVVVENDPDYLTFFIDSLEYDDATTNNFIGYATYNGTYTFNVNASNAITSDLSEQINITFVNAKLLITLSNQVIFTQPSTSEDLFSINVQVVNDDLVLLENADGLEIDLELFSLDDQHSGWVLYDDDEDQSIPSGIFGTFSTVNGEINTTSFKILSSGNFSIVAAGASPFDELLVEDETADFTITNKLKSSLITVLSQDFTVYQRFEIEISLYGEDDNPFLLNSTVELIDYTDIVLDSNTLEYSNGENITFSGYSKALGTFLFNFTANNSISAFESDSVEFNFSRAFLFVYLDSSVIFT